MADYREELERRVGQFAAYLKKMHRRAHEEVHGSCFIIFDEDSRSDESGDVASVAAATPAAELIEANANDELDGFFLAKERNINFPEESWREDDSQSRFIQFSFERDWFCLDMPLQTLYRTEAEQILRSRLGFFYLRDRPEFTLYDEEVDGFDPFRKIYVYGDEKSAAEDMAFIFFKVWKFPLEWRFYVTAAAFGDKATDWENGTPIE